jgi:hypothetical protein
MSDEPCTKCPVLAICRLKETIDCELLANFLHLKRQKKACGNVAEALNVHMLITGGGNIITTVRDKDLADDLRNAGKDIDDGET